MTEEIVLFAIDQLYCELNSTNPIIQLQSDEEYPMFVTWKAEKDHRLCGCIGTTQPVNLVEGLKTFALKSALSDSRFAPISADYLQELVCTVSLLVDYELCLDYQDWTIGKHGISIKFTDDDSGRHHHALFLPEVMVEHSLSHVEAIKNLIVKSGYKKAFSDKILDQIKVTRFRSQKMSLSVSYYLQKRKEHESRIK